jgi:hypothetical protein
MVFLILFFEYEGLPRRLPNGWIAALISRSQQEPKIEQFSSL